MDTVLQLDRTDIFKYNVGKHLSTWNILKVSLLQLWTFVKEKWMYFYKEKIFSDWFVEQRKTSNWQTHLSPDTSQQFVALLGPPPHPTPPPSPVDSTVDKMSGLPADFLPPLRLTPPTSPLQYVQCDAADILFPPTRCKEDEASVAASSSSCKASLCSSFFSWKY